MDLTGDGKADLISGSWPGQIFVFKGLGKQKFAKPEPIVGKNKNPIKIYAASTVYAVDWNADKKLDLLIGDKAGRVHFLPNEGTQKEPAFGIPQELSAGGNPIRVERGLSHPVAADWDNDGKLDLIVGCGNGAVLFFHNTGTTKTPKLAAGRTLLAASKLAFGKASDGCGARVKICVHDWNGDGKLDLLLGDMSYYTPKVTEEGRKIAAEAKTKLAALRKEMAKCSAERLKHMDYKQPRIKETEEQKTARLKKLKKAQERMRVLTKERSKVFKRYYELLTLERKGNKLTAEQQKELRTKKLVMDKLSKKYQDFLNKEYVPVARVPIDETAAQRAKRLKLLEAATAKVRALSSKLGELTRIANQYERPQLGGSVWVLLRK